jgi:hypothetical protein
MMYQKDLKKNKKSKSGAAGGLYLRFFRGKKIFNI